MDRLDTCQVIDRATMVKTKGWGLTKVPISPISVGCNFATAQVQDLCVFV